MLHKMTGDNLDDFPEALKPLMEVTDEKQQSELSKELRGFVDKAFAAHNRRVDEETWARALNPIFKGKERAMIKTAFEEKIDEGIAIGEERGEAKGKVDMLLKILQEKFCKVPKETEKAIRRMTDPIALDSWAVHAATCQSMKEFADALK
jgi:flagellar biosynthesis/type III secretory pathway protein FliH